MFLLCESHVDKILLPNENITFSMLTSWNISKNYLVVNKIIFESPVEKVAQCLTAHSSLETYVFPVVNLSESCYKEVSLSSSFNNFKHFLATSVYFF